MNKITFGEIPVLPVVEIPLKVDGTLVDIDMGLVKRTADANFEFSMHYLLDHPSDIIKYAADYFDKKSQKPRLILIPEYLDLMEDPDEFEGVPREVAIKTIISRCPMLRFVPDEDIPELARCMKPRRVETQEIIIRQDDEYDYFYVIEKGRFEVSVVSQIHPVPIIVNSYNGRGCFGELAILYNRPRLATVRSLKPGRIWTVDPELFRCYFFKHIRNKRNLYGKLFDGISLFKDFEPYNRIMLIDLLQTRFYQPGEFIYKEKDESDGMYFTVSGKVTIMICCATLIKCEIIGNKYAGEYFGEFDLLKEDERRCHAVAARPLTLGFLDIESFRNLMAPAMKQIEKGYRPYNRNMKRLHKALNKERKTALKEKLYQSLSCRACEEMECNMVEGERMGTDTSELETELEEEDLETTENQEDFIPGHMFGDGQVYDGLDEEVWENAVYFGEFDG